ncbi:MAG: DUF4340 domain-containing protein [Deltaproteobacteria bacterium]|nr:DUF4340 domain-containing protein [Deltaproteobacteria bacterium]
MKKSTLIAVLVFVGLLIAAFFVMRDEKQRGISRIAFDSVAAVDVHRVRIAGANPVDIERKGEAWVLGDGRKANQSSVKALVETLAKLKSSDLVTRNEARFAELEVDEAKGAHVEIEDAGGKELARFTVGKVASGGSYVRVDDGVYLVKGVYQRTFSRKASDWHELKLFDVDFDKVDKVELRLAGKPAYGLVRKEVEKEGGGKEQTWELADASVVPEGFRFDSSAARSLARSVVSARAREIVLEDLDEAKAGLASGFDVIRFEAEGQAHELQLGADVAEEEKDDKDEKDAKAKPAKKDRDIYARVAGSKDIYVLRSYTAKGIRKSAEELRDMKFMQLDVDAVVRLSIAEGKESLVLEKQGAEWKIGSSSKEVPGDFELGSPLVTGRLRSIANARASELADPAERDQAGLGEARLVAEKADGSKVELLFGKNLEREGRKLTYASGNADGALYLVTEALRKRLTGMLDTFKKRPPPAQGMPNLDPQTLSKLPPEVRGQLMEQMRQKQQQQQMLQRIQEQMKQKKEQAGTGKDKPGEKAGDKPAKTPPPSGKAP